MTADNNQAGAVSRVDTEWHTINWRAVHQNVRRLQARIVKATQAKRWNKVKALQHLLTHSFSSKVLAVRRVTENTGKKTAGVDTEIWDTPEKKMAAVHNLKRRGYKPLPLRRVYIPKEHGKMRPLSIPAMRDRAMQALYLLALDPVAETTADPNSYGFRRERSAHDALKQCFNVLSTKRSAQWILEGDIKSCFDTISHEWLVNHIPMDKMILRKWLKAGFVENNALFQTESGTPQGGICSPVLANMALDGLETKLHKRFPHNKHGKSKMVNLVRYADDFILTGRSKELLESEVRPLVEEHLRERGLELSPEKTNITQIEQGFDFLGQNVRKYQGKLLIKPAQKNVQAFLKKVREILSSYKQIAAGQLVKRLNPILRGWANYHRHAVSKRTFSVADTAIFRGLWQWAKRRHPNKRLSWVRNKYFFTVGNDHWTFGGEVVREDGSTNREYLIKTARTPIQRHIKVKAIANPYDPAWESYFEGRLDVKMESNLVGRRQLLNLWLEQHGLCPVCREKITQITGWHSHHIVWRVNGGSDGNNNRVLLHPNCHRQVHSQKLEVKKPRFDKKR